MKIYVILQCAHFHDETLHYDRFLTLAKNEEEARAVIEFYAEDQKNFRMASDTYISTRNESPNDLYPYGAICVESGDVDISYYYKTVDI